MICMKCLTKIIDHDDGWLEWLRIDGVQTGFHVCHNDCRKYVHMSTRWMADGLRDHHLFAFSGDAGLARFLAIMTEEETDRESWAMAAFYLLNREGKNISEVELDLIF